MKTKVNNELYHELGDRWYEASDDPIALLRAESKVKNPWVIDVIQKELPGYKNSEIGVLDLGCGAGFLSNALSRKGYQVTGLDLSVSSLAVAGKYDSSKRVTYVCADAYELPFPDETFEAVACMDFLEHVEDPGKVICEAARVLKKDGVLIFHTFNRNWLAGLIIIKGMEWLVKNTPKNLHVLRLFIKPKELIQYCVQSGLRVQKTVGISPVFNSAFFKLLAFGVVPDDFNFKIGGSPLLGYLGYAKK